MQFVTAVDQLVPWPWLMTRSTAAFQCLHQKLYTTIRNLLYNKVINTTKNGLVFLQF